MEVFQLLASSLQLTPSLLHLVCKFCCFLLPLLLLLFLLLYNSPCLMELRAEHVHHFSS